MKILYDHQTFSYQKTGGVSRYFFELMRRLSKEPEIHVRLSLEDSPNLYLKNPELAQVEMPPLWARKENTSGLKSRIKEGIKDFPLFKIGFIRKYLKKIGPTASLAEENQKVSVEALEAGGFDVFHPTYYDDYFLPHLGNKPLVVTFHDMIHELFHGEFPEYQTRELQWKKNLASRADRIIAISENTKKDLIRLLQVPEEKIRVIHHGPPLQKTEPAEIPGLPSRFILFVGDRQAYKNFRTLAQAFGAVLKAHPACRLLTVGGGDYSADEEKYLTDLGIRNSVVHLSWVSDGSLAFLYTKAAVFCFPSLYEGFGFPILEAFGHGCPVAASEGSSFHEVAGEAAAYFSPRDPGALAEVLLSLLGSSALREEMKERGLKQLEKFSWESCAAATLEVYREAAALRKEGKS